jgi:hypothetical protein
LTSRYFLFEYKVKKKEGDEWGNTDNMNAEGGLLIRGEERKKKSKRAGMVA